MSDEQISTDQVEVTFTRSTAEIVEGFVLASFRQKAYWFFLALVLVGFVLAIVTRDFGIALPFVGLLAMLVLMPIGMALFRVRINPRLRGPFRQRYTNAALELHSELGDATLKWEAFQKIVLLRGWYYMYASRQPINVVPRRAFDSEDEEETFRRLCRKHTKTNF